MIGQTVGHYRITARLGEGGMGIVYEAEDLRLPRHVALKFLPAKHLEDRVARERFEREARAASVLSHPNICVLHDVAEHDNQPFLVMERLQGTSLRERLQAGPVPAEEVLRIGIQVADALEAAHQAGIVHRDVKPANIFLTEHGHAKVLDFGVARLRRLSPDTPSEASTLEELTGPGAAVGTIAYMSPEQVLGRPAEAASDVFSLGVVLYEMLTGARPFPGNTMGAVVDAILHTAPTSPVRLNPQVPVELERIVNRCLEKDAAKRWASAAELRVALSACLEGPQHTSGLKIVARRWARSRRAWAATALIVAGLAAGTTAYVHHQARVRWAREEALPEIRRLADGGFHTYRAAYTLALKAQKYIPRDPELQALLAVVSREPDLTSEPQGATVWSKPYAAPSAPWTLIGVTPIERKRMAATVYRFKVEKAGFASLNVAAIPFSPDGESSTIAFRLDPEASVPAGMVRVTGARDLPGFFIDRDEVTNRAYKAFVDAGGYREPRYWKHAFEAEGRILSFDEAMARLVDRTGRAGPATWEAGGYLEGRGEYPVTGVSWYEAAAYAEFAGKALPTVHHWEVAAGLRGWARFNFGSFLLPISNFKGAGPLPVGTTGAISPDGVADLAGNVREWCWNRSEQGRCLRGGAWNDQEYMFKAVTQAAPFHRSEKNGLRCAQYVDVQSVPASVFDTIGSEAVREFFPEGPVADGEGEVDVPAVPPRRIEKREDPAPGSSAKAVADADIDVATLPPSAAEPFEKRDGPDLRAWRAVSDDVFAAYRAQYDYDPRPLDARVEARDESHDDWVRERVSFNAAYGGERVIAQLFLPRKVASPYRVVVYFPGAMAFILDRPSDALPSGIEFKENVAFYVRSGRAVLYPVVRGAHERRRKQDVPIIFGAREGTRESAVFQIQQVQDVRRSVDYLVSRPDIDHNRLAFCGFSYGGQIAPLVLAVDDRFATAIIHSGGLTRFPTRAEVNPVNFVSHVRAPVLMVHGRYDLNIPFESEARPLFERLGTPGEDKRLYLASSDHWIPRTDLIREALAWLDKYLGRVAPAPAKHP